MVKISDTLFMVLWQGGYTDELAFDHNGFQVFKSGPVYYTYLDEDGKQLGDIKIFQFGNKARIVSLENVIDMFVKYIDEVKDTYD